MPFIHHFIHLYFFTEFEIFFYIYYILPYEKQLVYDLFSRDELLDSLGHDDVVTGILDSFSTRNYDNQCALEQDRIDANHNKLWSYCFIYIIVMNILLFLFFVKDLFMCYCDYNPSFRLYSLSSLSSSLSSLSSISSLSSFSLSSPVFCNQATKYKKNDFEIEPGSGYEMNDLSLTDTGSESNNASATAFASASASASASATTNVNISFGVYYWRKSEFLAATWNTIQFIILIGGFEYLFFVTIVNKYKVISAKLLLCKLIQE
jgi:hypothetical protein